MYIVTLIAAALLVLVLAAAVARTARRAIGLYAWVAVPEAAAALWLGLHGGGWELWLTAAAILVVKGLWVPRLAAGAVASGEPGRGYGVAGRWSPAWLLAGTAAVWLVTLRAIGVMAPLAASLAITGCLVALFIPLFRYEAWSQAVGILLAEACVTVLAFALLQGLPAAADAVALADLLALGVLFAVMLRLLPRLHGTYDVRALKELRG